MQQLSEETLNKTITLREVKEIIEKATKVATSQKNSNITIGIELAFIRIKNYIEERKG
jgi:hypothetical protein